MQIKCPECDGDIPVPEDVVPGEIVPCPDCGSEFEVYLGSDGSIELKPVEIEGEDWGE